MRRAKILATLGPSSRQTEVIEQLVKAGLNAVRINMSHGTQKEHTETIRRVREVAERLNVPLGILIDLCGPKIRTRSLKDKKPVQLTNGEIFKLTTRDIVGNKKEVSTTFQELPSVVQPGASILLDDGSLELRVEEVTETDVICRVVSGGLLYESKGINLPNTPLPIPSLTKKDRQDLAWAVKQNADYIALSFVRSAEDCFLAKELINQHHGRAQLVAKIEKAEAIENLGEIIKASDGVMVARGDLGVETSVEMVPVYQKRIIESAIQNQKFVITATQMLQSMVENPRPTRAEASDVANAVWDGTDAVMLSAETAAGKHPVESVQTMARIINKAEAAKPTKAHSQLLNWAGKHTGHTSRALCEAAAVAAEELGVEKTAVFTESGLMARRLSSLRPSLEIFALTSSPDARNELALIWGVNPLYHPASESTEEMLMAGENVLLKAGVVEKGETIVMMAGRLSGLGLSSSVVICTIGEAVPRR